MILTWNLTERAFRDDDGSRRRYPLLRGSGKFAKFVRNLGDRFKSSRFFELDTENNKIELSESYRFGLISQYCAEYESNATFRVKEGTTAPQFLTGDDYLNSTGGQEFDPALISAWDLWPTKRFRISRYGFLQVILETKKTEDFVTRTQFLSPIKSLHERIALNDGPGVPNPELGNNWPDRPELDVTAQWEIVGRIMSRIIEAINLARPTDDLLRFDPQYRFGWREKQAFVAGTSLPLRTEYIVISVLKISTGKNVLRPKDFSNAERKKIASLLEEIPWLSDQRNPQSSYQNKSTLDRILKTDDATWDGEMGLLSFGTAIITTLHPQNHKLPRGIEYQPYWKIVGRVIEYFAELRQLARLVERQSADLFEYMLHDLANKGRLRGFDDFVRRTAGLSGLVNRLRVASSPDTIAQNDAILAKLRRLQGIFEIGRSLEIADHNLSSVQRLITNAESKKNEDGILLLTAGLAGFTAVLMGLALPPYLYYASKFKESVSSSVAVVHAIPTPFPLDKLDQKALDFAILGWGSFSIALTIAAILTATWFEFKFLRIGRALRSLGQKAKRWLTV